MGIMALPANAPRGWNNLSSLVDDIWHHAGDKSVDVSRDYGRSCGKVVFSQASVILFTGVVVYPSMHLGRHIPACTGVDTPPDGHCRGRYASYWNAFLFFEDFQLWRTTKLIENMILITKIFPKYDDRPKEGV